MTLDPSPAAVSKRLGPIADATAAALAELAELDAVSRLWAGDHTLWRDDPTEISDRLGWLSVVPEMLANLDVLRAECDAALAGRRAAGAVEATAGVPGRDDEDEASGDAGPAEHVLLMGMGGSSLFPEVVARSLGGDRADRRDPPRPRLHVVDTTDPAAIHRLGEELPPERTLHIAASKSGTTLETRSHLEWAWARHPDPRRFAVITDPGSELAALARDRGFVAVWEARSDIGGRYSALSHFGIVPALLAVPDVAEQLLLSASTMAERLRNPASANPAAQLAATLAAAVRSGRDKVTLVEPAPGVATSPGGGTGLGPWLEQLLAESTGKDGTGVIPVVGEPLGAPDVYGDDRLFVVLGGDGTDAAGGATPGGRTVAAALDALAAAGHPVYVADDGDSGADGPGAIGGQLLLWEVATALCGALLGIHPFDQPDVAAAKAATARVLQSGLPDEAPIELDELLYQVGPGDYLAIQAFVDPGSPVVGRIEEARAVLRDRLQVATTVGLGPRFLHSTGQLHKGGPATGVFVQVVGEPGPGAAGDTGDTGETGEMGESGPGAGSHPGDAGDAGDGGGPGGGQGGGLVDVPVPGRAYGFATLERAQAAGDLLTLRERGRRAGRVALDELLQVSEEP